MKKIILFSSIIFPLNCLALDGEFFVDRLQPKNIQNNEKVKKVEKKRKDIKTYFYSSEEKQHLLYVESK